MALTRRTLRTIFGLLSLGALGTSTALATVPPKSVVPSEGRSAGGQDVADRLGAIRHAVSVIIAESAGLSPGDPNIQKAWWGNWHGGWRNGGWRNGGWRNGGWGWHNGGWHNGGWRNGGWPNFWQNW
jgi:rSAM-associated Gly-rich repeat protein